MPSLRDLVPDIETLLALDPEDLGHVLLTVVAEKEQRDHHFHPGNYEGELFGTHVSAYAREKQESVCQAVREAFAWLSGQALIVPTGGINGVNGFRTLSRRGRRLLTAGAWQEYRKAALLPRQLLHPTIADAVYTNFQKGDYPTAVFIAFKELEVAVRDAASLPQGLVGVQLMRRAFDKSTGPLRDPDAEEGEREALAHLFAGAIGSYKNPHSHRAVAVDAGEAVEMILLASHLLKIVISRSPCSPLPDPARGGVGGPV